MKRSTMILTPWAMANMIIGNFKDEAVSAWVPRDRARLQILETISNQNWKRPKLDCRTFSCEGERSKGRFGPVPGPALAARRRRQNRLAQSKNIGTATMHNR